MNVVGFFGSPIRAVGSFLAGSGGGTLSRWWLCWWFGDVLPMIVGCSGSCLCLRSDIARVFTLMLVSGGGGDGCRFGGRLPFDGFWRWH